MQKRVIRVYFHTWKICGYGAFCVSMDEPDTPSCHSSGPRVTNTNRSNWMNWGQTTETKVIFIHTSQIHHLKLYRAFTIITWVVWSKYIVKFYRWNNSTSKLFTTDLIIDWSLLWDVSLQSTIPFPFNNLKFSTYSTNEMSDFFFLKCWLRSRAGSWLPLRARFACLCLSTAGYSCPLRTFLPLICSSSHRPSFENQFSKSP